MRLISAVLVFAVVAGGQESRLTVSDPSWNGLQIAFVSRVEPSGRNSADALPGAVIVEPGRAHHLINDNAHKSYFGYDILLEPSADGDSAQIRIEPLRPVRAPISGPPGWKQIQLPQYPVIPNVRVGDTVALDLLVNPATGQKIVDYLKLERRGNPKGREAHDFGLTDVALTLSQPRVWVNGKLEGTMQHPGGTSGSVVWFYLAGRGRFNLSLFPSSRFQKSGEVSENAATFRDGATEYRIESSTPIVPGVGVYTLYVWLEPDFPGLGEPFSIGSESSGSHLTVQKD